MLPVPDCRVPGHQFFQFLMGRGFAQVRQHGQHQHQVLVRLNAVGLGCLNQRVHNGTGFRSFDTVAEQPVLSAYHKLKLPEADENLLFIDSRIIDCRKLMPMAEFVDKLFEDGGTFTALTALCEDDELDFGTPLFGCIPTQTVCITDATLFLSEKVY